MFTLTSLMFIARNFFTGVLILLLTSAVAWAQATAQLSGTVTDDSGGVLPGVTVTATQTDTAFTRTVVTDGAGAYVMPNLPLGPYRLNVELGGFQTYIQTGIVLQVGDAPVIDAALGLSALEETVTVEAAAPLVDVQSAGIGDVVGPHGSGPAKRMTIGTHDELISDRKSNPARIRDRPCGRQPEINLMGDPIHRPGTHLNPIGSQ